MKEEIKGVGRKDPCRYPPENDFATVPRTCGPNTFILAAVVT
jgi:hypothetical protein